MAEKEKPFRGSGQQVIDMRAARGVLKCTPAADIGFGGGIVRGGIVVIAGKSGIGKTTLALQYAANAQRDFGAKVFFFPVEGRFNDRTFKQIRNIKLDQDHFEVIAPPPILKDKEIVGHKKWNANQWWTIIGDTVVENPGSILIVDSISTLTSEREQAEGMGYQGRGDLQKSDAQFTRLYGDVVVPNGSTLFLLTQIQANTSGYGPPIIPKLSNSLYHQSDLVIQGKSIEKWKEEDGRIRGHNMVYTVIKNAGSDPYNDVTIPLRFGYGVDVAKDVVDHAVLFNIVQRDGAWYTLPFILADKDVICDSSFSKKDGKYVKLQGEAKVREFVIERPDCLKFLIEKVEELHE
jgi:recombination protein RecA